MEMRLEGQQLLAVHIQGLLRRAELDECRRSTANIIREAEKAKVLVLLDGFQGWASGAEWGDVSRLAEHDSDIEKITIVGQEGWRDQVLVFAGVGLRQKPVQYFPDSNGARAWLADQPSSGTAPHASGRSS